MEVRCLDPGTCVIIYEVGVVVILEDEPHRSDIEVRDIAGFIHGRTRVCAMVICSATLFHTRAVSQVEDPYHP